jgi:hypothetical protein
VIFNPAEFARAPGASPDSEPGAAEKSQSYLESSDAKTAVPSRDGYGLCNPDEYCLGYRTLFQPLRPSFMNLLLGLIAADDPACEVKNAVDFVEQPLTPEVVIEPGVCGYDEGTRPVPGNVTPIVPMDENAAMRENRAVLTTLEERLKVKQIDPDAVLSMASDTTCEQQDRVRILQSLVENNGFDLATPRLALECFRKVAVAAFASPEEAEPHSIDLLRAAIADFLFEYKMSQAYPHEFVAYDLSMTADTFNTAISPLVEAFLRDLRVFEDYLRVRIDAEVRAQHLVSREKDFYNSGTVSLSTLSGYQSVVNTNSVSFLDASQAPTPSALLSSILSNAPTATSAAATASPVGVGAFGNLSLTQAQLLAGAIQAYQSQQLQVSRSLNLSFTPRSLIGASAAELSVMLSADEPSAPSYYPTAPGGTSANADSSYVANHDVTTHVRVDSIKLFEVSAFSAVLQNGHRVFPLLPPGLTLPYIGTLVGWPLPSAKQYHSSTAILEATVVPTATDLAYGLRFVSDEIVADGSKCEWPYSGWPVLAPPRIKPCTIRRAVSLSDFAGEPIREFHRIKVQCLATNRKTAIPTEADEGIFDDPTCTNLSFRNVFHQSN